MEADRLRAFSDGVIAVIITIMVLAMRVPHGQSLQALLPVLPVFLCYVLSFLYVGIYWNNHHRAMRRSKMDAAEKVDELIHQYHAALGVFMNGNPEPAKALFSRREDASLANPYGPPVRGWQQIARTMEHAASLRRDGELVAVEIIAECVRPELAYVVEIERLKEMDCEET